MEHNAFSKPTIAAMLAACGLGLAPAAALAQPQMQFTVVAMEGESIPRHGPITVIDKVAVNDDGDWMVFVNSFSSTNDEFVLVNGNVVYREGDIVSNPFSEEFTVRSFSSVSPSINNLGETVFNLSLIDAANTVESGVFKSGNRYLAGEFDVIENGPDLFADWQSFAYVNLNDNNELFVLGSIDEIFTPGTFNRGLVKGTLDATGETVIDWEILHVEGQTIPGLDSPLEGSQVTSSQISFNNAGQYMWVALLQDDTPEQEAVDEVIMFGSQPLAQEGTPSIVPGRNWGQATSTNSAVNLNNAGDYIYRARLAGESATDQILVVNGQKFIQKGDANPALPQFQITSLATGAMPVRIADNGDVVWFAGWNDSVPAQNSGYFRNNDLIIQRNVTQVDGEPIVSIPGGSDVFDLSDNGRFAIFKVSLPNRAGVSGFTDIALLVEFLDGTTCPLCAADYDQSGGVDGDDITAFFGEWQQGAACADVDLSGGVDGDDIPFFFERWQQGGCN